MQVNQVSIPKIKKVNILPSIPVPNTHTQPQPVSQQVSQPQPQLMHESLKSKDFSIKADHNEDQYQYKYKYEDQDEENVVIISDESKRTCPYCSKVLYDASSKYKHMRICPKHPKQSFKLIPKGKMQIQNTPDELFAKYLEETIYNVTIQNKEFIIKIQNDIIPKYVGYLNMKGYQYQMRTLGKYASFRVFFV